jgi:hypothetical protein
METGALSELIAAHISVSFRVLANVNCIYVLDTTVTTQLYKECISSPFTSIYKRIAL